MKTLAQWNRLNERNAKADNKRRQRRRDIQVEKDAGIWEDPKDKYLTKGGKLKTDLEIPVWFKNIYKTWSRSKDADPDAWNQWCKERADNTGTDPRKEKRKVGRPKLPQHLKKNPTKVKRSDQMMELLHAHGIELLFNPFDRYDYPKLKGYPGWKMVPNGKVRYKEESPISVHHFLQNFAAI